MRITRPIRDVAVATPRAHIVTIELQGTAFPYAAGQAIRVSLHGHSGARVYSLAESPRRSARAGVLELLVGVDAAGGQEPIAFASGALVDIDGPVGGFVLPDRHTERGVLFIAGGTGIAPLRAMLHQALEGTYDQVGVLYSARTANDFAYEHELRQLAQHGRIELDLRVTRDQPEGSWDGGRGRLAHEHLAPLVHGRDTLCFVCGPQALVEDIPRALRELGVAPTRILTEQWTPAEPRSER